MEASKNSLAPYLVQKLVWISGLTSKKRNEFIIKCGKRSGNSYPSIKGCSSRIACILSMVSGLGVHFCFSLAGIVFVKATKNSPKIEMHRTCMFKLFRNTSSI